MPPWRLSSLCGFSDETGFGEDQGATFRERHIGLAAFAGQVIQVFHRQGEPWDQGLLDYVKKRQLLWILSGRQISRYPQICAFAGGKLRKQIRRASFRPPEWLNTSEG